MHAAWGVVVVVGCVRAVALCLLQLLPACR